MSNEPGCPHQGLAFLQPMQINAGLPEADFRSVRALGNFGQWRQFMLQSTSSKTALANWRARDTGDLGMMLVEMGAYVADVVCFYDAMVSCESYMKCAALPGTRRELAELMGYRPRPAVASEVLLAAQADGVRTVTLPSGTAFRCSAFLDEHHASQSPQVFELSDSTILEPRINRLTVSELRQEYLGTSIDHLLVAEGSCRLKAGDPIVLAFGELLRTARVASIHAGSEPRTLDLRFTQSIAIPAYSNYQYLKLLAPGLSARLWQAGKKGSDTTDAISGSDVLLEAQSTLRSGEVVLFEKSGLLEARKTNAVSTVPRVLMVSLVSQTKDKDGNVTGSVLSPDIHVNVSKISLNQSLPWGNGDVGKITVYYSLSEGAKAVAPLKKSLDQADAVGLLGLIDSPRTSVNRVLLEDARKEGVEACGRLDASNRRAVLDSTPIWGKSLTMPVQLWGNVLRVSRGESVKGELLGYGDGSKATLTFQLKKMPLTYLNAANAEGLASTLSVRVGGVLWHEVPSFFGCASEERVFIVRHNDDGECFVTFGGAARVPTGAAIVADYRFGAGAAVPPAGSVTQMAKPVPGLKTVHNVLPAYGGADAETPKELASNVPRSALLLGRAVSLVDLEAAVASVPGVRAVRTHWRWDAAGLAPFALIQYIGDEQVLPFIRAKVRGLMEPGVPFAVEQSLPQSASFGVQLIVDPDYDPQAVKTAVHAVLYEAPTVPGSGGLLRPERLGPEGALVLSRIVSVIMGVPGVADIQSLSFNGSAFTQPTYVPSTGHYWDIGEPINAIFHMFVENIPRKWHKLSKKVKVLS